MDTEPATIQRNARTVSNGLKKAGFNVGYKYRQTGYETHDGRRITEPGVEITRKIRHRYDGLVDAGGVQVIPVSDTNGVTRDAEFEVRLAQALTEMGLTFEKQAAGILFIADDVLHAEKTRAVEVTRYESTCACGETFAATTPAASEAALDEHLKDHQ